jgi:hypothetical protein
MEMTAQEGMAERGRFELPIAFRLCLISSQVHSLQEPYLQLVAGMHYCSATWSATRHLIGSMKPGEPADLERVHQLDERDAEGLFPISETGAESGWWAMREDGFDDKDGDWSYGELRELEEGDGLHRLR